MTKTTTMRPGKTVMLLAALLLLLPLAAGAQPSRDYEKNARQIQEDKDLYWGTGVSTSLAEASNMALADLLQKIFVFVSVRDTVLLNNIQIGDSVGSSIKTGSSIETSFAGALTDVKTIKMQKKAQWTVTHYVEKYKVDQMHKLREERVKELARDALKSERERRIDDALRRYYWAYCLLQSLPNASDVLITDHNFVEQRLQEMLPEQIDDILDDVEVKAGKLEGNRLNLEATYDDKPVNSLDVNYSLDGGKKWHMLAFKDGMAQIELPDDYRSEKIPISYEYRYEQRSSQGGKMLQMMVHHCSKTEGEAFKKAESYIRIGGKKEQKAAEKRIQAYVERASMATNAIAVNDVGPLDHAVRRLLEAIDSRKFDKAADLFTPEGYDMYQDLIAFGNASLIDKKTEVKFYGVADGRTICRSIPMSFTFSNNHIKFTEGVSFTFNPEGKIESLAFTIDNHTREAIFNSKGQWSASVRMAIATFLENYKTAFALKRLDYIKSIFDDCAIIVTGTVTKRATGPKGEQGMRLKDNVKYNTYNKSQYMQRMEQQFRKNPYINLRFTDVGVDKISDYDEFAMRIKQDYFSSSYSDTGYLFLMVDMDDPSKPLIKLRTWQPYRDPSINGDLPKDDPFYGLICERNFQ